MFESALLATCLAGSVDPALVLAIVDRESGGDPHALNVNGPGGGRRHAPDPDGVARVAAAFVAAGRTVDLGLMQLNSATVARLGETLERALDPCTNLALGERVLAENVATAAARGLHHEAGLRAALSLYNTGTLEAGFANGYVDAVWSRYAERALERARTVGSRIPLGTPPGPSLPPASSRPPGGRADASSRVPLRGTRARDARPGARAGTGGATADGGEP